MPAKERHFEKITGLWHMMKSDTMYGIALVAQGIERGPPEAEAQVRFLSRAHLYRVKEALRFT